jgi:ketosteroid isomerase-like protein
MSSRNRLTILRLYEALQARDYPTLLSLLSPEIRISHSPGLPWGGTYEGHDGAKEFFERLARYVNSYVAIERVLDSGDQIAVTGRTYGATRRTGRRFDVPIVYLWELKDGVAIRLEIALDLPAFQVALADAA